ncbi:MAG: NAD(P)H-dependent oxidoreductase [SAR324 cluster bacterium]|nr:NAD(P)H-dependent oxidoreductase [SAR324 cluster bacterium]MCZ6841477.1 NAD(P)H-dependent oxidoreductase [SAR324 cluster bacterium]
MEASNSDAGAIRLLAVAGSMRAASFNRKLLAAAVATAEQAGAQVEVIELRELELPLYDGDLEAESGAPDSAKRLKEKIAAADGLLIACPEYNNSIPGAFKNAIDWASRGPDRVFPGKAAAIMGASPGGFGAVRALLHLRQVLNSLGVWTVPGQVTISKAGDAFDEAGALRDPALTEQLDTLTGQLLEYIGSRRRNAAEISTAGGSMPPETASESKTA